MSRAEKFWSWFVLNERRYRDMKVPDREALLDELQENLQSFCSDLWFEVGGPPDGARELVITAEGKLKAFPELRELCRSAPSIPGWKVVAFKQPQGFEFTTQYEDIVVAPEATWFLPLFSAQDPNMLGLRLAFSHFIPQREKQFRSASYIMLEAGLGELIVAELIAHIEVCIAPSSPESEGFRPLKTLPEYISHWAQGADD